MCPAHTKSRYPPKDTDTEIEIQILFGRRSFYAANVVRANSLQIYVGQFNLRDPLAFFRAFLHTRADLFIISEAATRFPQCTRRNWTNSVFHTAPRVECLLINGRHHMNRLSIGLSYRLHIDCLCRENISQWIYWEPLGSHLNLLHRHVN